MKNFSVVLVEPRYSGNVGSIARVMKNFGFSDLILVNPPEMDKDAVKMAMHAVDVLRKAKKIREFDEIKDHADFLVGTSAITGEGKNFIRTPIFPEQLINAGESEDRIGLIFGREDYGLFNEEIEKCDILVTIPSNTEYPTLNISHSVAIMLYELSKIVNAKKLKAKKIGDAKNLEKEVLMEKYSDLVDCLELGDFRSRITKKTFRQILGRAFISRKEAFTLIGTFKKIYAKIKKEEEEENKI